MKVKTSVKEFKEFENAYLEEECENEVLEFTVLTGYNFDGAGKTNNEEYFSSSIKCVAYTNKNNDIVAEDLYLTYYLNNSKHLKYIHTKNLSVYNVKCKKIKGKNCYYLLKIKKAKDKRFKPIIQEYLKPITTNVDGVSLTFNRNLSQYEGKFVIKNKKVDVYLEQDGNGTSAEKSIATFKKIKSDFIAFYQDVLKRCSKDIVVLANEWKSDDDEHTITEDEIIKRIDKNNISIEICGNHFTIYFEDDDMFLGHTIVYYGNIDNDNFSVDIAG